MKTKIFNFLAPLAAVVYISTHGFQDVVVIGVIVVVGFRYLQQRDQIEEQRTAQRAELITRLDRWQQDVKAKARRAANVRS